LQAWLLAGEAISKCDHVSGAALGPEVAAELMKVYLAKGAMATTAIEGNTLTEDEVRRRIDGKLSLPPSKEYLGIEIDNIVAASNEVLNRCRRGALPPLSVELIKRFNRQVLQSLTLEQHIRPGELRTYPVGVADYRGAPFRALAELLDQFCRWLAAPWIQPMDAYEEVQRRRLEGVLKAIVAHVYLAWIHPFGDGNGRTARLVEFYLLVNAGVPFPAAHLLSNHYNETRAEYYRQLSYTSKSGGDLLRFCMYAMRGFVDQLRQQIEVIQKQQLELFWRNYVHEALGDSETGRRRRYLVEDLSTAGRPVPKDKLTELSTRVLRHYVGKHDKTLSRDLDKLEKLRLLTRQPDGYVANTQLVLSYLPLSHP
jgi:Fic family protein